MNFGTPFWRQDPLAPHEAHLISLLTEAHHKCAFRDNLSTHAVMGSAQGSGDYLKSITAALATLGGLHAPIGLTMCFLAREDAAKLVPGIVQKKQKVPGWGDSFNGEKPDPIWQALDEALKELCPPLHKRITAVTKALHKAGVKKHPNPACYTASIALLLDMPPTVAPYLFIVSRLPAWSNLFLQVESKTRTLWELESP